VEIKGPDMRAGSNFKNLNKNGKLEPAMDAKMEITIKLIPTVMATVRLR